MLASRRQAVFVKCSCPGVAATNSDPAYLKNHRSKTAGAMTRSIREMTMRALCGWITGAAIVGCLTVTAVLLKAQGGAPNGEWPTYGGDLGNTHYSALDQIKADNFNSLEIAWRFKTDSLGPRPEF